MGLTTLLVFAGVIFLVGFMAGARFEEINLERRERQLARARREFRQTADAVRAYEEVERALVRAGSRLRRDSVRDAELLVAADELSDGTGSAGTGLEVVGRAA
jgi:hypothetical protein